MSHDEIIRAWKDPAYRGALSQAQLGEIPLHPAGAIELLERDLDEASGATAEDGGCEDDGIWLTIGGGMGVTAIMSCFPSCGKTAWKGTCGMASIGCCLI
jgi:mersacidin/lichenicidin family type 2 lantibiotic